MVFLKKLGLLLLAVVAMIAVPGFLWGLLSDHRAPGWFVTLCFLASILTLLGGIIYLAVDAAQRHNR